MFKKKYLFIFFLLTGCFSKADQNFKKIYTKGFEIKFKVQEDAITFEKLLRSGSFEDLTKFFETQKKDDIMKQPILSEIMVMLKDKKRIEKYKIISFLLDNGADINALNKDGYTALTIAIIITDEESVKILLDKGASVNMINQNKETALYIAIRSKNEQIVKLLISAGSDVNVRDNNLSTPLHHAAFFGLKGITQLLLEAGADFSAKDKNGYTPLRYALKSENEEAAITIIYRLRKSDINLKDANGDTFLHLAAFYCKPQAVSLLLKKEAEVNVKNKDGITALTYALLLSSTFSKEIVGLKSVDESDIVKLSLQEIKEKITKLLIEAGSDVNSRDVLPGCLRTPMHWIAIDDDLKTAELLIKKVSDINAVDSCGKSPLHLAAYSNAFNMANFLLKNGAIIDLKDQLGGTALHTAASCCSLEVAYLLIQSGLKIEDIDNNGHTALHIAVQEGHIDMMSFLLHMGANIDAKDSDENTALHLALEKEQITITKFLILSGCDVKAQNKYGDTALHIAAKKGNIAMLNLLLSSGCDNLLKNKNDKTWEMQLLSKKYSKLDPLTKENIESIIDYAHKLRKEKAMLICHAFNKVDKRFSEIKHFIFGLSLDPTFDLSETYKPKAKIKALTK